MNLRLEQLTQILAKVRISSSLEEEILTIAESLFTPPEANKESTCEEPCIFNEEPLGTQKVEEDCKELQHDLSKTNYAYEILIEHWFQESTRLVPLSFLFYFVNLELQQLISHAHTYSRLSIAKLKDNIFLLLLRAWLHWMFDYT
jgi:hypothetical protein